MLTTIASFPQDYFDSRKRIDYDKLTGTKPPQIPTSYDLVPLDDFVSTPPDQPEVLDLGSFHDTSRLATPKEAANHVIVSDLGDDIRHGADQFNQDLDSVVKKIIDTADQLNNRLDPERIAQFSCKVSSDQKLCCRVTSSTLEERDIGIKEKRKEVVTGCVRCMIYTFSQSFSDPPLF